MRTGGKGETAMNDKTEFKTNSMNKLVQFSFDHMADGVCITDWRGWVMFSNPAAREILEIGEKKNGRIWEMIPFVAANDELIQLFIDAISNKQSGRRGRVQFQNTKGEMLQLLVHLTYSEEAGGMFVIVITDLTRLEEVSSAFERYTSPEIADMVLSTPEGARRGGNVREVSILMSDLRGFTSMSAHMSPDTLVDVLNHYFEEMVHVIYQYRGTVIEFVGDGIFVVFGAPKDDPDHAVHAAACAIDMENVMEDVNRWNIERGYPELRMGIGINTGDTVVGNIGSRDKMKYGCMGNTVNLAGRAESYTIGGQIYITEYTAKAIGEQLEISGWRTILPKGADHPVRIGVLNGIGGKYRKRRNQENIAWADVPKPRRVNVYPVNQKDVSREGYPAVITGISLDRQYCRLRSETGLEEMQDIMMDVGDGSYGKVIRKEEDEYIIAMTSISEEWHVL